MRDLERGLGRFASAVEFEAQATGAGLGFGPDGEDFVDHGNIGFQRDAHQGVGDGPQNFLRVEGAALPDDAEGDDRRVTARPGETLDLERNLVGAGNPDNFLRVAAKGRLRRGEERVGVFAIEYADDEGKAGFGRTSHGANS